MSEMPEQVDNRMTVVGAGAGEVLDVFGAAMVVKAQPASRGFFLGEHVIPPGYAVPLHVHAEDEETFFVLDGELTLFNGNEEERVGPGVTVRLPASSRHGFRNDTSAKVRFLVMACPGVQSLEMFRRLHQAGGRGNLTPEEIGAICARYGVTMG